MKQPQQKITITRGQMVVVLLSVGLVALLVFVLPDLFKPGEVTPPLVVERQEGAIVQPVADKLSVNGLDISYEVGPNTRQTDMTRLSMTFKDLVSGQPTVLVDTPKVWINSAQQTRSVQSNNVLSCDDKIRLYLQGSFDFRPELDLTSYYILALNPDSTISVIDPDGGVNGISQLYSMIFLDGNGEDWVLDNAEKLLYVSMPDVGKIAVVDVNSFKVLANISAGSHPTQLKLQPGGGYLWVANTPEGMFANGGVTVIDTYNFKVAAHFRLGEGAHTIAFGTAADEGHAHTGQVETNSSFNVFVTDVKKNLLTVIDAQSLREVKNFPLGMRPAGLAYSEASDSMYITGASTGQVVVLNATTLADPQKIETGLVMQTLRFSRDGRWGFALSPANNQVLVIDAQTNQVRHAFTVDNKPTRVTFSEAYAYVQPSSEAAMVLFDLAQLGQTETPSPVKIIGGQTPADKAAFPLAQADAVVPVHGGTHVLIANSGDQTIYSYMEGMNAPMGSYQNYGRAPLSVLVVDRGLVSFEPGVFSTEVKLPHPGEYEVAFLTGEPHVAHCFNITANSANPDIEPPAGLELNVLTKERKVQVGSSLALEVELIDTKTRQVVADLPDVIVLATLVSGQESAQSQAPYVCSQLSKGLYGANLLFSTPGLYNIYFKIPSRNLEISNFQYITVEVTAAP